MQSEERLVRSAQAGDDGAFEVLYEEYFDKVYRYIVVRVGNQPDAEDLTEEVFLKALQAIASFEWRGVSIGAWLFRIAHNVVVDHLRRISKRQTTPIEDTVPSGGPSPHEGATINIAMEKLKDGVKRLTQAQQQVLSLRLAGGLSIAETAKVMGKTEGAVKASQHSALVALRRMFATEYGDGPED